MSYTYGYIREAVQAHLDLDETETQAMNLQERYHIFANEAMQAICAVKPKYDYFKVKGVLSYTPLIDLGNNQYRQATEEEINWEIMDEPEPNFADKIATTKWYEGQQIYLINTPIKMPEDFIAFAVKQAWAFIVNQGFNSELFIKGMKPNKPAGRERATKDMFMYSGRNTITLLQEGEFWIPYKGIWFKFQSGIEDDVEIDIPIDILVTIPLYVAAVCLQIDHAQKSQIKRVEFETALARVSNTDFLELMEITPTFK